MISNLTRRTVIGAAGAGVLASGTVSLAAEKANSPGLAITVDDFNLSDTPLLSGLEQDAPIRKALRRHGVKAGSFVAGKFIDAERSPKVLATWSNDGHLLGNHTFSHSYYGGKDPDGEMADILRCEPLLTPYASFRQLFRFPYLAEGKRRRAVTLCGRSYANTAIATPTSRSIVRL